METNVVLCQITEVRIVEVLDIFYVLIRYKVFFILTICSTLSHFYVMYKFVGKSFYNLWPQFPWDYDRIGEVVNKTNDKYN